MNFGLRSTSRSNGQKEAPRFTGSFGLVFSAPIGAATVPILCFSCLFVAIPVVANLSHPSCYSTRKISWPALPGTGLAPRGVAGLRFTPAAPRDPTGMNPLLRLCSHAWIVVLVACLAFTARHAAVNLERAEQLSEIAGGDELLSDAKSPSGYAGGVRKLVLPELNHDAQQWIVTTQQMLARNEWRLRRLDTDNAPFGRTTLAPSPYRWWLGIVAQLDHAWSGRPLGQSVERAALLADPLLHALLLLTTTLFAARQFGGLAAALLATALTLAFPFAGNFLSPLPGDRVLAQFLGVWTLLPLAAALLGNRGNRTWFPVSALAGAALLWTDAGTGVLLLGGIFLGGCAALFCGRSKARHAGLASTKAASAASIEPTPALPQWRRWSWIGAGATLIAWLAEYAPAHLGGWRLDHIHPLHALAWLGMGELLHLAATRWLDDRPLAGIRNWVQFAIAVVATLALPIVAMAVDGFGLLGPEAHNAQLALTPGTTDAVSFRAWGAHAAPIAVAATLLPLALLVIGAWRILRGVVEPAAKTATLVLLGPVLLALAVSWRSVGHWATVDVALLTLLAVLASRSPSRGAEGGFIWALIAAALFAPSLGLLAPKSVNRDAPEVSDAQLDVLLHRDLARWIARRAPDGSATVLAPPATTSALIYFGGFRGLSTPDPENKDGFGAAVRICGTSSMDEAMLLTRNRRVTHLVLPSWDTFLEEYARLGNNQPENSLVSLVRNWLPPRWLRPMPYTLPGVDGLGSRQVLVLEVSEVQEKTVWLARLAEYFAETGQVELAAQAASSLENSFPEDPNAWIARAAVAGARGDGAEFGRVFRNLKPMLDRGEDEDLSWERRTALALLLAQTKQTELARPRIAACVAAFDETRLLELTPQALFRFLLIAKAYGVTFEDAALRAKAVAMLPTELQAKL